MSLKFKHIALLRLGLKSKLIRNNTFFWADKVGYLPSVIIASFFLIFMICTLSAIWIKNPLTDFAVFLFLTVYSLTSMLRVLACVTPRPKKFGREFYENKAMIEWPTYSVFVPLYHEPDIVKDLIGHLSKIDYPQDKLDITLICERDDQETISELWGALKPPFSLAIVETGGPKTKPNALNYALERTQSELITIYDAEDRPHSTQLKAAALAFHKNPNWGALQAPLIFYNARKNFLTRQFALEYAALFFVWVPFLSRMGCPFPLGGTSNHIRRETLDIIGGWDSFNVTEDADLSFRLALISQKIGYIRPYTEEEVVSDWQSWSGQRSRWMKGFMQTFNLHMHAPFKPHGWAGFIRFFTLQITIGVTLLTGFCHLPFLAILAGSRLGSYVTNVSIEIPPVILICLVIGYISGILTACVGALRSKQYFLLKDTLWMPFYWIMLFGPTLRAAYELKTRPFYWNKTKHGHTTNTL